MKKNRYKKIITVLLLISLAVIIIAGFVKDLILREVVCASLERQTGLPVELDELDYKLFKTALELRGLRIMNPKDLGGGVAIALDRVYIDSNLKNLLNSKTKRIDRCEIDVASMNVLGVPGSNSNLDQIADRIEKNKTEKLPDGTASERQVALAEGRDQVAVGGTPSRKTASAEEDEFWIGTLKIKLDKVTLRSDSDSEAKSYNIGQTLEFENVVDFDDLGTQLMMTIFVAAGPDLLKDIIGTQR